MHPVKQFWTLCWFQAQSNPKFFWRILLVMLLFNFPLLIQDLLHLDHSALHVEIPNFTVLLLPSMMFFYRGTSPSNLWFGLPTDFLLTRAVDRNILYRSTTTLVYVTILAMPLGFFFISLNEPPIHVTLYPSDSPQLLLSHLPGSTLVASTKASVPSTLLIPHGKQLFAEWRLWTFLTGMLVIQLLSFVPLKWGWLKPPKSFLTWVLHYFIKLLLVLFVLVFVLYFLLALFYLMGIGFFCLFAAHQTLFWIVTVPVLLLGQICCEQLFARVEQK